MANAPWYRTGTVAVTNGSTAVTGTQTLWTGQVTEGDIFKGPDGKDYEVASVTDNTHLTLRTPYLGATAGAQSYAIVRNFTGTLPAELAANLASMLAKWHISVDDFLAVLLDTGSTSTINDATGTPRTVTSWAGILGTIGGRLAKALTGGTVALTDAEAINKLLDFSGALTSNAIVTLPAKTGTWAVSNGTTGNYSLTIKAPAGTGIVVPQGGKLLIRGDGTNVALAVDLTSLGAGSMAVQNANAVAVTGGAVNGTTIGATTPSSGAFTTLSASGGATFDGVALADGAPAGSISLTAAGQVGVGTSSPRAKFNVQAGNGGGAVIESGVVAYGGALDVSLYLGGTNQNALDSGRTLGWRSRVLSAGVSAGAALIFESATAATYGATFPDAFVERVKLSPSGRMLVGAPSDDGVSMVQVNGSLIANVLRTASYTKATVPAASAYPRGIIYVSDASGGAAMAWSNGTNWISQLTNVAI